MQLLTLVKSLWAASLQQVNRLCITPDKHYLAVGGNPHIRLYDVLAPNPNPIISFEGHSNNVTSLGFQKDRKWMYSGSEDGSVKIWDPRTPACQRDYPSKVAINSVALHPNQGEIIAGDEDGNLRVWDLAANKCSHEIVIPEARVAIRSVCIASDASLVVAATNRGTVYAWRFARGQFEALQKIEAHNTYCLTALLSPDVKFLATTSADKTTKIFNLEQGFKLEKTLIGHTAWIYDCAFSADSAYLVTASSDRTAKVSYGSVARQRAHATGDQQSQCAVTKCSRILVSPDSCRYSFGTFARVPSFSNTKDIIRLSLLSH